MFRDFGDEEVRKQKVIERFKGKEPACIFCGETDWRCIEEHHIGGQAYDPTTVPVCANCHRKLSDMQKDHPPKAGGDSDEVIGRILLGLADVFVLLIEKLHDWGRTLIERSSRAGGQP
jgi:hypothetical protein